MFCTAHVICKLSLPAGSTLSRDKRAPHIQCDRAHRCLVSCACVRWDLGLMCVPIQGVHVWSPHVGVRLAHAGQCHAAGMCRVVHWFNACPHTGVHGEPHVRPYAPRLVAARRRKNCVRWSVPCRGHVSRLARPVPHRGPRHASASLAMFGLCTKNSCEKSVTTNHPGLLMSNNTRHTASIFTLFFF